MGTMTRTARKKGAKAGGALVGTVLLSLLIGGWFVPLVGGGVTAYFAYKWLHYRAKYGMKF